MFNLNLVHFSVRLEIGSSKAPCSCKLILLKRHRSPSHACRNWLSAPVSWSSELESDRSIEVTINPGLRRKGFHYATILSSWSAALIPTDLAYRYIYKEHLPPFFRGKKIILISCSFILLNLTILKFTTVQYSLSFGVSALKPSFESAGIAWIWVTNLFELISLWSVKVFEIVCTFL